METTETLTGELHLFGFERTPALVHVVRHTPRARAHRALVVLGACWGTAAVTVLVPIAHFVLVPGFFIAGIVMAARRLREPTSVVGVAGVCPRCAAERKFDAGGRLRPAIRVSCPTCHNTLDLSIEPAEVSRVERSA
jgi:hypothetical protein